MTKSELHFASMRLVCVVFTLTIISVVPVSAQFSPVFGDELPPVNRSKDLGFRILKSDEKTFVGFGLRNRKLELILALIQNVYPYL